MAFTNLQQIAEHLQKNGVTAEIPPATQENPYNQLVIPLGLDEEKRTMAAMLRLIEQQSESGKRIFMLHTFLGFPFPVTRDAHPDMARLANLLNKILVIPGLIFSEADSGIAFHHVNVGSDEGIAIDSVEFVMMTVVHLIDSFYTTVESVASGKKKYDAIVEEAIKEASKDE